MLSLDVGRKRIGLAGCDALCITVNPIPALVRRSFKQDLMHFDQVCQTRGVKGLVVGLPLDEAGQVTKQAIFCQRYGHRLALALGLPLALVNEHSSSWAAAEQHGLQGDRSGRLDSVVAAMLLEQWMAEGPEPEPVKMATLLPSRTGIDEGS